MSDPENFLSRWSRRKRKALREVGSAGLHRQPAADASPPSRGEGAATGGAGGGSALPQPLALPLRPSPTKGEGEAAACPVPALAGPAFDPASLPPIQSITAETDIRGFLGSGVAPELTRAALRRAWASDPKIKNFVGLADYDWDFNAADSMAGFGPLAVTDVEKMAARIIEPDRSEQPASNLLGPEPKPPSAEQIGEEIDTETTRDVAAEMPDRAKKDEAESETGRPSHPNEPTRLGHGRAAAQYASVKPDNIDTRGRRKHGGALPK